MVYICTVQFFIQGITLQIEKGLVQGVNDIMMADDTNKQRGINIYSFSQILGINATDKTGKMQTYI